MYHRAVKILLLIAVTILAVGCGEWITYEPELEERGEYPDKIAYLKGSDAPYTGTQIGYWKGQKESERNFKDGKKDGLELYWHENGQKSSEVNYRDGRMDGLLIGWHSNGQQMMEVNYKDGKIDGLRVGWHSNGNKFREENWKDGELISEKWWNNRGEPVDSFGEASK